MLDIWQCGCGHYTLNFSVCVKMFIVKKFYMKDFKMPNLTYDSYKPVIKSTKSEKSGTKEVSHK